MWVYYRAAYLTRLVDWHCHAEAKHWVAMEIEDSGSRVRSWPWIASPLPKVLSDHPTLGSSLLVSRDAFHWSSISPLPSLMVPIFGKLEFEPRLQNPQFSTWCRVAIFISGTFWGWMSNYHTLHLPPLYTPLDFLSGLQLQHFLRQCSRSPGISRQLMELESICHRGEPIRHNLSTFYAALIRPATGFTPFFISQWEANLAMQFTNSQKEKILHFTQKFFIATKVQKTNYYRGLQTFYFEGNIVFCTDIRGPKKVIYK